MYFNLAVAGELDRLVSLVHLMKMYCQITEWVVVNGALMELH